MLSRSCDLRFCINAANYITDKTQPGRPRQVHISHFCDFCHSQFDLAKKPGLHIFSYPSVVNAIALPTHVKNI